MSGPLIFYTPQITSLFTPGTCNMLQMLSNVIQSTMLSRMTFQILTYEPEPKKTGLWGFRPGPP